MLGGKGGFKGHTCFVTCVLLTAGDCATHWTASSVPPASGVATTDCSHRAMGASCLAHGKPLSVNTVIGHYAAQCYNALGCNICINIMSCAEAASHVSVRCFFQQIFQDHLLLPNGKSICVSC